MMARAAAKITLIVARAANGVIGAGGAIPWRLASDLKQFKAATLGKPVLMGRKTWDSLPKRPLPGRPNLVWTRDGGFRPPGAWAYSDLAALIAAGRAMAQGEVCIIGGGALYRAAMPLADRLRVTEVALEPAGDVFFPPPDAAVWRRLSREAFAAGPGDDADFTVSVFERI
ncbi:MAG: dihydrofolate reductase [Hyphomonadaceae bacterium]